jgi:hypothetical protein
VRGLQKIRTGGIDAGDFLRVAGSSHCGGQIPSWALVCVGTAFF